MWKHYFVLYKWFFEGIYILQKLLSFLFADLIFAKQLNNRTTWFIYLVYNFYFCEYRGICKNYTPPKNHLYSTINWWRELTVHRGHRICKNLRNTNAVIIIIMKMHPLLSFVSALILTVISVVTRAMNVLFASWNLTNTVCTCQNSTNHTYLCRVLMRFQLAVYKNLLFLSQWIDTTIRIPGTQCWYRRREWEWVYLE